MPGEKTKDEERATTLEISRKDKRASLNEKTNGKERAHSNE